MVKMRFYLSLYLLVAGVYLLTASGRIGLSDSIAEFNVAQSVIDYHSFSTDPCEPDVNNLDAGASVGCVPGTDGRHYAGYGQVPSLMVVPIILIARSIAVVLHANPVALSKVGASIFTSFVAALVCVVLAQWMLKLGYSRRIATVAAFILAFASPFWNGSVGGFLSAPYFALALLTAACLLSSPRRRFACALAGLAFGVACGTRLNGVVLFPAFILFMAFHIRANKLSRSQFLRDFLQFSAAFSVCALLIAWVNYAHFGSPFKTGYHLAFPTISALFATPILRGMFGLLFNGEVGLLVYAPWVIVAVICFPRFARKHPGESMLCGAICLIYFIFFAKFSDWHGGTVGGPRLLLPLIPFLVVMTAPAIEYLQQAPDLRKRNWKLVSALIVALFASAFVIQLVGTMFPIDRYYVLEEFYRNRPEKPWWNGSIPLAGIDFVSAMSVPKVRSLQPSELDPLVARRIAQSAFASAESATSEQEFLGRFPNSANMSSPNLVWLKVRLTGLPDSVGIAYPFAALAVALLGAWGLFRYSGAEPD
jgi:hypothetical protein